MKLSNLAASFVPVGATVWCLAIVAAPLFHVTPIYEFFSVICHQQPTRSWHLQGEPLAVCIRCASIYFGFLAGLLMLHTPNVRGLQAAILLTAGEWIFAQLIADVAALRAVSGILLGAFTAPFVRIGVEQMFARLVHEPM